MELVGDNCNKKNSNKNRIFMRKLFLSPVHRVVYF